MLSLPYPSSKGWIRASIKSGTAVMPPLWASGIKGQGALVLPWNISLAREHARRSSWVSEEEGVGMLVLPWMVYSFRSPFFKVLKRISTHAMWTFVLELWEGFWRSLWLPEVQWIPVLSLFWMHWRVWLARFNFQWTTSAYNVGGIERIGEAVKTLTTPCKIRVSHRCKIWKLDGGLAPLKRW